MTPIKTIFDSLSRVLSNVFVCKPKKLDSMQRKDLMNIITIGTKRLHTFMKQYILHTEPTTKRERQRIRTFTNTAKTQTQAKTQLKNVTTTLKNSFRHLQAAGISVAQTAPYPLALADINGKMRTSAKSLFRNTISQLPNLESMFTSELPPLEHPTVVVDLLYYLHMPPPADINTFEQHVNYLWSVCVESHRRKLNPDCIYIVIDKPKYLPPPREVVHTYRSDRTNDLNSAQPVGSTLPIPHGTEYSASLCIQEFKADIVEFVTTRFILMAQKTHTNIVIDSPAVGNPLYISDSTISNLRPNQHGEADYAIWHHTIHCQSRNCLVVASDTDVWVYGLGLWEAGWLSNKLVIVQRGNSGEYVNINLAARLLQDFAPLQTVPYPVSTMVALYVLSGCDYVSSFFKHTKQNFLECFFSNIQFVLNNNSLITFVEDGNGHTVFESVSTEHWLHLVCSVYLDKHSSLYSGQTLERFRDSFIAVRKTSWMGWVRRQRVPDNHQ